MEIKTTVLVGNKNDITDWK